MPTAELSTAESSERPDFILRFSTTTPPIHNMKHSTPFFLLPPIHSLPFLASFFPFPLFLFIHCVKEKEEGREKRRRGERALPFAADCSVPPLPPPSSPPPSDRPIAPPPPILCCPVKIDATKCSSFLLSFLPIQPLPICPSVVSSLHSNPPTLFPSFIPFNRLCSLPPHFFCVPICFHFPSIIRPLLWPLCSSYFSPETPFTLSICSPFYRGLIGVSIIHTFLSFFVCALLVHVPLPLFQQQKLNSAMISSENNLASPNDNSPDGEDSHCGGSVSPSSLRDSQSRASTNDHNNISQHSLHDETPLSPSLANISTNIELHPQNDALGGSSSHKFIKRPLNAYMIWTRQERKRILTDDPKMKMNEVSKAMGEKWKKMSDKDKKPYFELAKKFSEEHKLVLQEHPELQYAPSKKKAVKKPTDGKQQSLVDSSSVKSCTITPDASRSTTPRGSSSNLITPQPISQSQVFSPFQSPLASSTVQLAQVLQGVRSVTSQAAMVSNASIQNPLLGSASTFPQAFLQSHSLPQRVANSSVSLLGGISHANTTSSTATSTRTTPGQMLDLYYTSLCQPAFPSISENPVNPLGMYPSQYLLEQYNQQLSQQQGSPSASANPNTNGGGRF